MFNAIMNVTTTPMPIGDILDGAGQVLTKELSWVGNIVNTITSYPLLFVFLCGTIAMLGINLFGRLRG